MSEEPLTPKKVHPDQEELESLSKTDLINRIREQEQYIRQLEAKKAKTEKGDEDADFTERLRQQQKEAARRENTLVHRLTTKEQELQDLMNQIAEVKQAQTQGTAQLRSMLLDPAVNTVFQKMAKEMEESQEKLKQTQNELSAWKFTPDSQTGKRLMARCQMLLQENEELGKTIASGRTAKLEGEIGLMKTLVTEMKNNQSELDEFLGDLEEDVEGMQTMTYVLQQQLREAKEQISSLEEENSLLRAGKDSDAIKAALQAKHNTNKGEKTKPPSNTDDTNHTLSDKTPPAPLTHRQHVDYAPMETGFYTNEKTDSDLEAEYNYEGLYENEDKYQEMEDQPGPEEGQYAEYEENGYKNYDEYEGMSDFAVNERERKLLEQEESSEREQEVMDTTEGAESGDVVKNNGREVVAGNSQITSSHSHLQAGTDTVSKVDSAAGSWSQNSRRECSDIEGSATRRSQVIDTTDRQQLQPQVDRVIASSDSTYSSEIVGLTKEISTAAVTEASSPTTCELRDSNHVSSTQKDKSSPSNSNNHHREQGYTEHSGKERTPDREPIPCPKPTKVSPIKVTPTKALTPEQDEKALQEHDSNSTDRSATLTGSGDPTHVAAGASPEDKGLDRRTIRTNSSPSNKRQSPGAGIGLKEREPVLQMFMNGVTSTVEDIEDI